MINKPELSPERGAPLPDSLLALQILEALPVPLFLFRSSGSLVYANQAGWQEFSDVLGTQPAYGGNLDKLLARIVGLAVYQDEQGRVLQPNDAPVMQALQTGRVVQQILKRYIKRTGAVKWYVNLGVPIRNAEGDIGWAVSANVDITSQQDDMVSTIASMSVLKAHAADMDAALRQHREWLAQTNDRLSNATDDLQQFIHVASHDLKEPARKIRTYATQMLQELEHSLPKRAMHQLQRIDHAASQLLRMLEGVLLYTDTDALVPVWGAVNLQQVVQQVLALSEIKISETKATVTVSPLPTVWGIAHLLQQLISNLLSNALKFSRPGVPVNVQIAAFQQEEAAQRFWVMSVTDNGIGIPAQYREQIFRPFSRLHSKNIHDGAGLGLSICQKIANYHGGKIKVLDNPQGGTVFQVYLPDNR